MTQFQYEFKKNDEYYTPEYAVRPIIRFLKPNSTVWCPFDTEESEYVKVLKNEGFKVVHTHFLMDKIFLRLIYQSVTTLLVIHHIH